MKQVPVKKTTHSPGPKEPAWNRKSPQHRNRLKMSTKQKLKRTNAETENERAIERETEKEGAHKQMGSVRQMKGGRSERQ